MGSGARFVLVPLDASHGIDAVPLTGTGRLTLAGAWRGQSAEQRALLQHLVFEVRDNVIIEYSGAQGGVLVNGKRAALHCLEPGDVIRIGSISFKLTCDDAAAAPADLAAAAPVDNPGDGQPSGTAPPAHPKAAHPAHGSELRLCAACGTIAPTQAHQCSSCHARLTAPLVVHDSSGGFWVGVECSFTCSVCHTESPLNYLATGGEVQCLRCGADVGFDRQQWWEALDFAHAVSDLCGPAPQGRFPSQGQSFDGSSNRFHEVGLARSFAEQATGPMSLHVRASPGHPLCTHCKQPLRVESQGAGGLTTSCPGCRERRAYSRPGSLPGRFDALGGVIDPEHERGGLAASVHKDATGAVALKCPNCAGQLEFDGSSAVVHCPFCKVAVRVPTHRLATLGQKHPRELRWWLYFTDVSPERRKLEEAGRNARKMTKSLERAPTRVLLESLDLVDDGINNYLFYPLFVFFLPALTGCIYLLVENVPAVMHLVERGLYMLLVPVVGLGSALLAGLPATSPWLLIGWRKRSLRRIGRGFDLERYLELMSQRRDDGVLAVELHLAKPLADHDARDAVVAEFRNTPGIEGTLEWSGTAVLKYRCQGANVALHRSFMLLVHRLLPRIERRVPVAQLDFDISGRPLPYTDRDLKG